MENKIEKLATAIEACAFLLEGEPPLSVVSAVRKRLWELTEQIGGLSRDEFVRGLSDAHRVASIGQPPSIRREREAE